MKNEMPKNWKQSVKTGLLAISERLDRICSTASSVAPPRTLYHQYGGGNFFDAGLEFFKILLDECGLRRTSSVLDVGCGAGRIAAPLQFFLSAEGQYQGFDIMPEGVEHCRRFITPKFPNFQFEKADIFNSFYNPQGAQSAENYTFPRASESCDIVISTSVMTHLPPLAAARYIAETARVLKPGGVSLHTFFLLDDFAARQIAAGRVILPFVQFDDYMTADPRTPELAIALPQGAVLAAYEGVGLGMDVRRGAWCGPPAPLRSKM